MTGYLSNLAARTFDQPLVVRPRLASIFEQPPIALRVAAAPLAGSARPARSPQTSDRVASRQFDMESPATAVFSKQTLGDTKDQLPRRLKAHEPPQDPIELRESRYHIKANVEENAQSHLRYSEAIQAKVEHREFQNPTALRLAEISNASRYHVEPQVEPEVEPQDPAELRSPQATEAAGERRESQNPPRRSTLMTHSDSTVRTIERFASRTQQTVTPPQRELPRVISPERVIQVTETKREQPRPDEYPDEYTDENMNQDEKRRRTIRRAEVELPTAFRVLPVHQQSEQAPGQGLTSQGPSIIRITIGRIDVRAVMPGAQPRARVAEKKSSPALSLDEYLKQRSGAQR